MLPLSTAASHARGEVSGDRELRPKHGFGHSKRQHGCRTPNPMPEFVKVASIAEIPSGTVRQVEVRGHRLAVANVNGEFFAVDDACPHRGGPLGMGFLNGMKLECPLHAWEFDLRTGEFAGDPAVRVATYQVRIEGGDVLVAI